MKSKKTRYKILGMIIIPLVIICIALCVVAYNSLANATSMSGTSEMKRSIDSMDYHLRGNATSYQETLFEALVSACEAEEKDEAQIAKLVVENFIADFYTWTNKYGEYDVGGLYYVYSPMRANIYENARDNFYNYLDYYINEYGQDEILEVESIESNVSIMDEGYTLNDTTYDAWWVSSHVTYVDKDMDTSNFEDNFFFVVIKNEDGRFEIVQSYGEE